MGYVQSVRELYFAKIKTNFRLYSHLIHYSTWKGLPLSSTEFIINKTAEQLTGLTGNLDLSVY